MILESSAVLLERSLAPALVYFPLFVIRSFLNIFENGLVGMVPLVLVA